MFSTGVRFSGVAIGTQLGFLVAGFAPTIVTALGGVREGGWVVISIFTAVVCLIAAASALTARETKDIPTALLGTNAPDSERATDHPLGSPENLKGDRVVSSATAINTNPDSASASQAQINSEIAAIESEYQRSGAEETQPRLDYSPYRSSLLRHPTKALQHADPESRRTLGAGLRPPRRAPAGIRSDHPARRRTDRRADGGHRPGARRRRSTGTTPTRGDLAGQCRRTLYPQTRPAPGRAGPELHRGGPLPDRRRRHATGSPPSSLAPTRGRTITTRGGPRISTSRCSEPISPSA